MMCSGDYSDLAARMLDAPPAERTVLLEQITPGELQPLAWALTDICRTYWNSDPIRAVAAADLLTHLETRVYQPELTALAAWTHGIVELANGQMEAALTHFDRASALFLACQQLQTAAATQIGRLLALSMLGRYDEAIATGLSARDTFLAVNDQAAAGRVELNLGNIYDQCDQYAIAAEFFRAARERFVQENDHLYLLQADIGLANVYSQQRQVQAAAALYTEVLARAEQLGAARTQAIVERNLGSLSLDQGQYAEALRYLEQSRRRYARLDLPHEEALAERELADVYLELNLIPEAIAIYTSLAPVLARLKMSFELAWTRAHHGRAALLGGQFETARPLLTEARELFAAAGNDVCVAFVLILEAQRLYGLAAYAAAAPVAAQAARMLAAGGPLSWLIFAQWLAGDAARLAGDIPVAQSALGTAHTLAQQHALPQIGYRCATSLGLLALSNNNREEARTIFTQAVALIETLRSPLPVAMESTGDYWRPVYHVREGRGELLLVNAGHIKHVPGRKTDVNDAEWIADLLRHGLLRASFVPPRPQRALRDLTRQRSNLIRERNSVVNRLQKVLEDANIKLTSVATDITGVWCAVWKNWAMMSRWSPRLLDKRLPECSSVFR